MDDSNDRLTITDGSTTYQSRERWRVTAAALGDTDGNGLIEIITLLDADDGRRLGLFGSASVGGHAEYRERLVTSVLTPRPLALAIRPADALQDTPSSDPGTCDLVLLTEEGGGGSGATRQTAYRWNGFGFTAVDGDW